jgi:molybdopterin molybdotransferase
MSEGLKFDALITSGGVSVGKYDLVLETMKRIGISLKFWKVMIKPGMPFAFGVHNDKERLVPVFALPGNPVSTTITFHLFVRSSLAVMMGGTADPVIPRIRARLLHDLPKGDAKRHFQRGILERVDNDLCVELTGSQSSGVLTSLTRANCLIVLPEESRGAKKGDFVDVEILQW